MLDFLGGPVVKNPRQCGARFGGSECSGAGEDEFPLHSGKMPRVVEQLSTCATATEVQAT